MIKAARLKELLEEIPDDAEVRVFEGKESKEQGIGFSYPNDQSKWWIQCSNRIAISEDTYTEGFNEILGSS